MMTVESIIDTLKNDDYDDIICVNEDHKYRAVLDVEQVEIVDKVLVIYIKKRFKEKQP